MPEEFRQQLISHKKDPSAKWHNLAYELRNYLEEWVNGMEINIFEALKELIVVDQIKRNLPVEMKEHFICDLPKIKNVDIISKLDDYDTARYNVRAINKSSYNIEGNFYNKRNKSQIKC